MQSQLRRLPDAANLLLLLLLTFTAHAQQEHTPDITLHGSVTFADAQTYREVAFTVPPGVTRITVDVSYTEHDKKTSIDLGVLDSERFRSWSGGNKNTFTISETDATPSYLPGAVRP
jgi:hypothetical protein